MEQLARLVGPARAAALIVLIAAISPAAVSAAPLPAQDRPQLPDEQTAGTKHFLIHYTFKTKDAVDPTDADGNNVPDYVDAVGAALEFAWQREVVDMGWAAPPSDGGEGGDNRIDVYLENDMADDIAGYTESGGGLVGDNPNTPEVEQSAAYSFLSIDNNFEEADLPPGETPLDLMKVTVAHEFNHVLQAGYDSADPQTWIFEATATWMEGQVYPDISDAQSYLPDLLDHPESCISTKKLWYGSWLYMEYLSEHFGPDVIRSIWEHSRNEDGMKAIDDALADHQTSLADTSRDFAIANLLRAYKSGASYPTVHLGGSIDGTGTFAPKTMVGSLGASYVQITGKGSVSIRFAGKSLLTARVVAVQNGQADIVDFTDGTAVVDLDSYKDVYVVVHSDTPDSVPNRCGASDYALTVSAAKDAPSAAVATILASDFRPPTSVAASGGGSSLNFHQPYRGGGGSGGSGGSGGNGGSSSLSPQSPEGLKPGFTTLIPTPPDGYYFDYAYIMSKRDFGTSAPFYVPDAKQSANFDYLNGDGTRLTISEAPTQYQSLQDWEDGIQYTPDVDPQTINGVEVLLVQTRTQKHDLLTATFIDQGLFIVVEGNAPEADVKAMVLGLLAQGTGATISQGGTQGPVPSQPTPAAASSGSSSTDDATTSLMVFGGLALCGFGVCFAGIGVVAVVFLFRGKRR